MNPSFCKALALVFALVSPAAAGALQVSGDAQSVSLSWPDALTGAVLEMAGGLTGSTWSPVTELPTVVNGQNLVTLPLDSSSTYFRLSIPESEGIISSGQGLWFMGTAASGNRSARVACVSQVATHGIRLSYAGWFIKEGAPLPTTVPQPIRASIQLADEAGNPTGQTIPVTFSGGRTGVITPGTLLTSDPVPVEFAAGQNFFVITYQAPVSGMYFGNRFMTGAPGEQVASLVDLTDTATGFTTTLRSATIWVLAPSMITGSVTPDNRTGVVLLGDSIIAGRYDSYVKDRGFAERALAAAGRPYVNVGASGSLASEWAKTNVFGMGYLPLQHAQGVMVQPCFNDLAKGATLGQLQDSLAAIYGHCRAAGIPRLVGCTVLPFPGSTDGWATLENQTASPFDGIRVSLNGWILAQPALDGVFDLAAVLSDPAEPFKRATGPATTIHTGTAGAGSLPSIVFSTDAGQAWAACQIAAGGQYAAVQCAGDGVYGWIGNDLPLGTLAPGVTFSIRTVWCSDGAHPTGLGHAAAAAAMPVAKLFP